MANRIWRGDAVGVSKVVEITAGTLVAERVYSLTINGKAVSVTAVESSTAATLFAAFVTAIQVAQIPEWREVTPSTANGVLTLTSKAVGVPFKVEGLVGGLTSSASIVITISNFPSGGTFNVDFGDELGDMDPAYNASASTVQGLTDVIFGANNTLVTKRFLASGEWEYTIKFIGTMANSAVPECTVTYANLTGGDAAVSITTTQEAIAGTNSIQTVTFHGTFGGGAFRAGFRGVLSTPIAWPPSASTFQTAFRALSTVAGANANITGSSGGPYTVEFVNDLGHLSVEPIEIDVSGLTSPSISASIATTTPGATGTNDKQIILQQMSGSYNELIVLTKSGTVSSGSFKWVYNTAANEVESDPIPYNTKLATILATLEALVAEDQGDTYSGPYFALAFPEQSEQTFAEAAGGALTIACIGAAGGQNEDFSSGYLKNVDIDATAIGGGGSIAISFQDGYGVEYNGTGGGDFFLRMGLSGTPTGTMTLAFNSSREIVSPTVAELTAELETLNGAGSVIVTECHTSESGVPNFKGSRTLWEVEFVNGKAGTSMSLMTGVREGTLPSGTDDWGPLVYKLQAGVPGTSEVQTLTVSGTPSTGTLKILAQGQTTAPIGYNWTASQVATAITDLGNVPAGAIAGGGGALPGTPVTLTGAGPYIYQNLPLMVVDDSGLKVTVAETQAGVTGLNEKVSLSIADQEVWAGTATLTIDSTALDPLDWDITAADLQAEIDEELGSSKATVTGGPWPETDLVIEFDGDNAETNMDPITATDSLKNGTATAVSYDPLIVRTTIPATGPNFWSNGVNWYNPDDPSDRTVPGPLDNVWFTDGRIDCLYGYLQQAVFTVDTTNNYILPATDHDLQEGQRVRIWTTASDPPDGLAVDTDYYVRDLDLDTGKFRLATALGGAAVDIVDAGTGTHKIGVRWNKLVQYSTWSGKLGLTWRNAGGYKEYRPLYAFGGLDPSGEQIVAIGLGAGNGSSRFHINTGTDEVTLEVLNTAGSSEGKPSVLWLGSHADSVVKLLGGDLGIAIQVGESATFDHLEQRAGTIDLGTVSFATWDKTGGTVNRIIHGLVSGVIQQRQ